MDVNGCSFFILPESNPEVKQLDSKGDPLRKRAPHRKSRNGCMQCKRKKIKCNEKGPCSNCVKSKLPCDISTRLVHRIKPDASVNMNVHVLAAEFNSYFNHVQGIKLPYFVPDGHTQSLVTRRTPDELALFGHFQLYTSKVLAMSQTLWSGTVMILAPEHDFLMDSILLVAAAHVNHFLPPKDPSRRPLLHKYVNALSSLTTVVAQEAKSRSMTIPSFEAIASSSVLLNHYCWSDLDETHTRNFDYGAIFEQTVVLSQGLKEVMVAGQDVFEQSEWGAILGYSPLVSLGKFFRDAAHKDKSNDAIEGVFPHALFCGQGSRDPEGASADNTFAASRLFVPIRAINLAADDIQATGYATDVYRYLFTWPALCTKGYLQQVKEGNLVSLTILMCYYGAILRAYTDEIWFMRDKAIFMYSTLNKILDGRCERCMKFARACYDRPDGDPGFEIRLNDMAKTPYA